MAQKLKMNTEGLTLDQIIVKVTNMVSYDSKAQRFAKQFGLNINYVSWEDCARNKGSCWGPCISDMTLQVNGSCMPVMREPNYTDKTWDVAIEKVPIVIGNHTSNPQEPLQTISLKAYLKNFSDFMSNDCYRQKNKKINLLRAKKDSHVIMSSQACFLPIEQGQETKFNVALYNYQSRVRNPAVLVIVSTSKGSSAQIIEGKTQYLTFNNNGKIADFVGERVSDVRLAKEGVDKDDIATIFNKELSKEEKQDNVIVIVQVPLKQKVIKRQRHYLMKSGNKKKKKKSASKSMRRSKCASLYISDDEDANIEAAIIKVANRGVTCKCGKAMEKKQVSLCYSGAGIECDQCGKDIADINEFVWHCKDEKSYKHPDGYDLCLECGELQLRFDELRGMIKHDKGYILERNQDYPVRVTLQYYKATDNGSVTKEIMSDIAKELKASQKQADFIGSLVTEYKPNRPTDWKHNKQQDSNGNIIDVLGNYFFGDDEKKDDGAKVVVDEYQKIESVLKAECGTDWKQYLEKFKSEEVKDGDLKNLNDEDLKELIPKMGPRNRFKAWLKTNV